MIDPISRFVMDHLIEVGAQLVMPVMLLAFGVGLVMRGFLYFLSKTQLRFAKEFELRAQHYLATPEAPRVSSFHRLARILLTKTFFDCFDTKLRGKSKNLDYILGFSERLLLIESGFKRLIEDTLRSARYLKRDGHEPKMVELSKSSFEGNPYFNRLMGVFSVGLLNDLLNILPSLFIIGGIFGTFLGIAKSLPDLGGMDLSNMEETKRVMDLFLVKISQSMIKSILGIGFSVIMSVINTIFSVDGLFYSVINEFAGTLDTLWNETTTNDFDRVLVFPEEAPVPPAAPAHLSSPHPKSATPSKSDAA